MVRSITGLTLPIAYAVTSNEDARAYSALITAVIHTSGGVIPAFVMSDNSPAVISAMGHIFCHDTVRHLLCVWHSNTALLRASKSGNYLGGAGLHHVLQEERTAIRHDSTFLLSCKDVATYEKNYSLFVEKYRDCKYSRFVEFFNVNYCNNKKSCVLAFRSRTDPTTNNCLEGKRECFNFLTRLMFSFLLLLSAWHSVLKQKFIRRGICDGTAVETLKKLNLATSERFRSLE